MPTAAACSLQAANRPAHRPLQPAAPRRRASAPRREVHDGAGEAEAISLAFLGAAYVAAAGVYYMGTSGVRQETMLDMLRRGDSEARNRHSELLRAISASEDRLQRAISASEDRLQRAISASEDRLQRVISAAEDRAATQHGQLLRTLATQRTEALGALATQRTELLGTQLQAAVPPAETAAAQQELLAELVREAIAALAAVPNYEQPLPPKPSARQQQEEEGGKSGGSNT